MLQRLTIDEAGRHDLLTRLHAAQIGLRDGGLQLTLPAVDDPDLLADLGPQLDPTSVERPRRIACPTAAAAPMLALATDADARCRTTQSAYWISPEGRRVRKPGGTCRIPPRARPMPKAALLASEPRESTVTVLPGRDGRLLGPRQMANLIRRAATSVGLLAPHTGASFDPATPFAAAFTTTAGVTPVR